MGSGAAGRRGTAVAAAIAGSLLAHAMVAQQPASPLQRPSAPTAAGASLTISLVTMGVGARVWERFGHNAILVEDHERGSRTAYN